ncbi:MAG: hypothetical protein KC418_11895, partial [Anaerolineales bacterium]|nr:hypothetical protein [Anaerolineales bacterium]
MDRAFEAKLIDALDALEQGASLAEILARYPEDAAALGPMLETAQHLAQIKLAPSTAAKNRSRQAFLAEAEAMRVRRQPVSSPLEALRRLVRVLMPTAGIVAALLLGIILLSNTAIPGNMLYGVKLQIEDWRISLTRDQQALQDLANDLEARRLAEVQQLLAANLQADVAFGDDIALIAADHWELTSGVRVNISDQTIIIGVPEIGAYAHIEGRTINGAVAATLLHVGNRPVEPHPPVPAVTVTPAPSSAKPSSIPTATITTATPALPVPTNLPTTRGTPTATSTPSSTRTPSPTNLITPTNTPRPTQTAQPDESEASPTLTSTPEEDSDDDEREAPQPTPTPQPT